MRTHNRGSRADTLGEPAHAAVADRLAATAEDLDSSHADLAAPSVRVLIECGRHEVERAAVSPCERCAWCKQETRQPVTAGIIHTGSAGGGHIHACPACTATYRLMPLAEHPDDSDGTPRCRPVSGRLL
ncbi:hypothetical protein [Streptomyces sp. NPDC058657]|uniref:hypothetical protein n=1 Tax=unclassified Streptomyces TaxID=2593676 RepID=UPI00365911F5